MHKLRYFAVFMLVLQLFFCLAPAAQASGSADYIPQGAPAIHAASALLLDIDSGTVLYSLNADGPVYPASLTKVMTTLLALKYGNLDDVVTVSQAAVADLPWDASTANLLPGEQMTLEELLYCVMVVSANEACNVVAEHISGTVAAFVELMNAEAVRLGCTGTHFANPSGLHDETHYTTARDLATITLAALEYPQFVTICNTASKELPATNLSETRYLKTTNYLISNNTMVGYLYSKACGVKTGYTSQAGHCLISTAKSGEESLLSVITGAESVVLSDGTTQIQSFSQTQSLFEFGFSAFQSVTVLSHVDMLCQVPVTMATDTETIVLCPAQDVTALLPNDYDPAAIEKDIALLSPQGVQAPVEAGDVLGYVTVRYQGEDLGTIPLTAISSVARSELQYYTTIVRQFLANHIVQIVLVGIAVLFVGYIFIYTIHNYRRRKQGRGPR